LGDLSAYLAGVSVDEAVAFAREEADVRRSMLDAGSGDSTAYLEVRQRHVRRLVDLFDASFAADRMDDAESLACEMLRVTPSEVERETPGDRAIHGIALARLARVLAASGRAAEAAEHAREAAKQFRALESPSDDEIWILHDYAFVLGELARTSDPDRQPEVMAEAVRERVEICRTLARYDFATYSAELEEALKELVVYCRNIREIWNVAKERAEVRRNRRRQLRRP
jgi:hypothetical protein